MTIERPDWNFDNSGVPVTPEMPSPQETHDMIVSGQTPTPEITRAFADDASPTQVTPALVPAKYDAEGRLIRPDWSQPRSDATGRYISKSADGLRQQWEKEGTATANIAKVQAAEAQMVALAPSLQEQIEALPKDIQTIAADYLRLSPAGFGRQDQRLESFLGAMSPAQFSTFQKWFAGLSFDEQGAILTAAGMK